ncbi:MAG: hypothetical protein ACJAR1_000892 [Rubritalea sp.]|jgi:hypothetical protein
MEKLDERFEIVYISMNENHPYIPHDRSFILVKFMC